MCIITIIVSQEALFTPIHGHIGKFEAIGNAIEIVKSGKNFGCNSAKPFYCQTLYYMVL